MDVKGIRTALGLSAAAIRDWEQRCRQPDPAARVLPLVIAHNPDAVVEALRAAGCQPAARRRANSSVNAARRASRSGGGSQFAMLWNRSALTLA